MGAAAGSRPFATPNNGGLQSHLPGVGRIYVVDMAVTVSTQTLRKLLAAGRQLGADVRASAVAAGVPLELANDPEGRISHEAMMRLWDELARRTADDQLGLHVAQLARNAPDNVLAYAAQSCATLEAAVRSSLRYTRLVNEAIEAALIVDGARAALRLGVQAGLHWHRQAAEAGLALVCLFARQCADDRFAFTRVSFAHRRPARVDEHQRIFQCELVFEAPHHELELSRAALATPLMHADRALQEHLDRYLQDMLAALGSDDVVTRLRRELARMLRGGAPDVNQAAAQLAMSARTLQRQLQLAGTSFQAVLDDVRRELAVRYLDDFRTSLAEVGFLLGFAEASSFHRAFRRWTGMTPAEVRRRNRPAA
jgi:AraC-like DNA-binding protein